MHPNQNILYETASLLPPGVVPGPLARDHPRHDRYSAHVRPAGERRRDDFRGNGDGPEIRVDRAGERPPHRYLRYVQD